MRAPARLHKTSCFVSHDLDEAIALGGRIVLMKDGAIVQTGTAEEILAAPGDRLCGALCRAHRRIAC